MFMKTTIMLVFSMFLVSFFAHADVVIRLDIDGSGTADVDVPDNTFDSSTTGIIMIMSLENTVMIRNSKIIFDQSCLSFTINNVFDLWNTSSAGSTMNIPFTSSTLLNVGDTTLGAAKDLVTNSTGDYFSPNKLFAVNVSNGIKNNCKTAQNFEFSGMLSLGKNFTGNGSLLVPYRFYGTVQPRLQCSIYLPSTLDIGNYSVETINGKHAEVIANVSCTENASANIKIIGQRTLSNDNRCMLTNKTNDLLFCITMDSQSVDLSGNTGFDILVGPSGKSVVIGAEARAMGNNVAGEHQGELVVAITLN